MILSTYGQYVAVAGTCSLERYLSPPQHGRGRIPLFNFDYFQYHKLISYYINIFGRQNVLVLPFELFKITPVAFIQQIITFSGASASADVIDKLPYLQSANTGISAFTMGIRRRLNSVFIEDHLNPNPLIPIGRACRLVKRVNRLDAFLPKRLKDHVNRRMKDKINKIVGDQYRESNSLTSKLINIDLSNLGYDQE